MKLSPCRFLLFCAYIFEIAGAKITRTYPAAASNNELFLGDKLAFNGKHRFEFLTYDDSWEQERRQIPSPPALAPSLKQQTLFPAQESMYADLVHFYHQLGGSSWKHKKNWLKNVSYCSWDHISCKTNYAGFKNYLILTFTDNDLVGKLSSTTFGKVLLRSINELNIRRQERLYGTLPPEWGEMPMFRLSLGRLLAITGSLPPEWSSMRGLNTLSLTNMPGLVGTLPSEWETMAPVSWMYSWGLPGITGDLPSSWGAWRPWVFQVRQIV